MTSEQLIAQRHEAEEWNVGRSYTCPNCGGPSHFMGIDFKAPKISDVKAWRDVEAFIQSGKVYYRGLK